MILPVGGAASDSWLSMLCRPILEAHERPGGGFDSGHGIILLIPGKAANPACFPSNAQQPISGKPIMHKQR